MNRASGPAHPHWEPGTLAAGLAARITSAHRRRRAGDYPAAAKVLRVAIAAADAALGPDAVECGTLLNELGMVAKFAGNFVEAEAAYRRALAIEGSRGEAGAMTADILHNLAGLAHARGDAESALTLAQRGIDVRRCLPSPDAGGLAEDRAALAAILIDLGRHAQARPMLDELLRGRPPRYDTAVALHNLGSSQYRQGNPGRAAVALHRALALKRAELGRRHPDLAITLYNLGRCLESLGWRRLARRQWRRALVVLDGAVAADHPTLIACRQQLTRR
jgi:tetratricopeptide (TPR) repeat protein